MASVEAKLRTGIGVAFAPASSGIDDGAIGRSVCDARMGRGATGVASPDARRERGGWAYPLESHLRLLRRLRSAQPCHRAIAVRGR
ncbi:hypothetical protein SAMN00768000_0188 [Sulfobacillus thermosulfidooxidans DSM 9293]|uniref:Uncharacterized protein n=1 Tax=Sulfobacillus thermosulfidooxidans (strain DSM 9293 / VKM B-1269 / AT-1) TaxID=929705 RepID=A0A1W1W6Q8_SULTA|nr:hypothetical protein SAMN00768000_0188 [Sulfobacillus thermosulfidooxidans DSM 9293]